jgi:hypothetical protein
MALKSVMRMKVNPVDSQKMVSVCTWNNTLTERHGRVESGQACIGREAVMQDRTVEEALRIAQAGRSETISNCRLKEREHAQENDQ